MAIKIFTVFVFLVLPAAWAQNGHFGYDYRAPAMPSQLPSNLRPNMNQLQQPYNNAYQFQNGFVPSPIYHQHQYTHNDGFYKNQHFQAQQQSSQYNYQGYESAQSSYQNGNYNGYNENIGNNNLLSVQKIGSNNLLSVQTAQQTIQSNPAQNPSLTNLQPQRPIITKHIYFHLPPEDDTPRAAPVTQIPPKKTYNIIFIKLPSQKSTNAARLQQLINQQAAAESKTLIYVLVKKPELQPAQPVTSKPEVFFVKYKEPKIVAQSENSGSLQLAPEIQGTTAGLLPGQINGHGYK